MIELNLLPDVKLQYVHAQRARRRVISIVSVGGIVSVGVVVLFAIYVYAVQPVRGIVIDNGIKDANTKLGQIKDLNNYLTVQQQLAALPALHESKPVYSRIIGFLSTLNPSAPNSMRVTQLSIDSTADASGIIIQGYAPTYTAATVYQSTLQSALFTFSKDGQVQDPVPLFDSVKMGNTALGQDSSGNKVVNFTVTVEVNENVFAYSSTNAGVSVPNKNATNSAQNVPEVFAETSGGN